ncbi:hypothetical protein TVAG_470080 [Trichomonas vaginalis G3]|uniref:Protein-S-isoprenylcysteine O-methyltransferase n=1 Tax=Trichomonas vaginalis (strain ATCC PRA-98 / G3) TaxID=412133 RepID=A2FE15_TRIV3|nr:protein C-terminal S-isoprenylcysteine carboxyl O-methyltransferase protein [Trichomonas vaginalis G3]EAX96843.1 hypothetical protein TVAG_470080 [Trichomonas vaginalis G3]KAI5520692.1 protein C-terminal S-isoprenylcysteine carboxyl O-methyltransferase protein [Trichomonas vaginalis G3]|eukprot:XP_001309773.1 hypothetical protein [Trichomonas vaginalis G3]
MFSLSPDWAGIFEMILILLVILIGYSIAEYFLQKHFHPDTTDRSSFLITPEYCFAFGVGILEFLVESIIFPSKSKLGNKCSIFGLIGMTIGLAIRFSAILHAGKSFTHRLAFRKEPEHKLITTGIYRYIRHPSYLGFLIFAISSQIYLTNPIAIIGFYVRLSIFFRQRIDIEERYLLKFFPEYEKYRKETRTWMILLF